LGIYEDPTVNSAHQIVREFDLAGNTLRETNAARVNEQLARMGQRTINAFHHDALELPDGGMMVLAAVEQVLTDVQSPGPVDVIGDGAIHPTFSPSESGVFQIERQVFAEHRKSLAARSLPMHCYL
jgi:hypothetical protein